MPRADGTASRSGPSGPTPAEADRLRPRVQLRLAHETIAALDREAARTEESRSALVEALVLTGTPDRYLSPALLEGLQRAAEAQGRDLHAVLCDAVDCYLTEQRR